jgi:Protein of unknown function (DUF2510)
VNSEDQDHSADGAGTTASWQSDPFGRHQQRWWDGRQWTEKVRSGGTTGIDPPGVVTKPEAHGTAGARAEPITDAAEPLRIIPANLPRTLLVGVVLLAAILLLILVGIATA